MLLVDSTAPSRPVLSERATLLTAAGAAFLALLGAFALPSTPSLLEYWLPVGMLIGIGTGAITTGTSTPFADVYLFCTLATAAVAVAALWLVLEEKAA